MKMRVVNQCYLFYNLSLDGDCPLDCGCESYRWVSSRTISKLRFLSRLFLDEEDEELPPWWWWYL